MFFESIKFETHRLAPRRKITSVTWDKWGRLDIEWKTCPDSGLNREKKGKLIEQRRCTLQNGKHAKHTSRCERPSASQGETTTTHFKAPLSFFLYCNNVLLPYLFPGKDNRSACTARFSFNYFFFPCENSSVKGFKVWVKVLKSLTSLFNFLKLSHDY